MSRIISVILILLAVCGVAAAAISIPAATWAGDGLKVAVAGRLAKGNGIYFYNAGGGRSGFVAFQGTVIAMRWPASDAPIAVLARHSDGRHYLWLLNNSGIIKRLTSRSVYVPKAPCASLFCWSPDQRTIAFASNTGGNVDVWRVQVGTGREQRLTDTRGRDYEPTWSPDGSKIAFTSERTGSTAVWIIPANGGSARRLVYGPGEQQHPSWSPDGHRIAFLGVGDKSNSVVGIYAAALVGGDVKPIAVGGSYYSAPVWSNTGKWISYSYGREPSNLFTTSATRTVGWGPNYQTSFDHSEGVSAHLRTPEWAPDRDQLVFATYEEGQLSIRIATLSEKHGPKLSMLYTAPQGRARSD